MHESLYPRVGVCVSVGHVTDVRGEDSGHIGCRRLPADISMFILLYVHGTVHSNRLRICLRVSVLFLYF